MAVSAADFLRIKCGISLFLAGLFEVLVLFDTGDLTTLPMICGLGIGFLLLDRILISRMRGRACRLRNPIPPALDLIVLSMETV